MNEPIKKLTIEGFKSVRSLQEFKLESLNVLIGANGAGKSNFVGFFHLLREIVEQRLQLTLQTEEGGADGCLYMGPKITKQFAARVHFGRNSYAFTLVPTVDNRFVFASEASLISEFSGTSEALLGSGHSEAKLKDSEDDPAELGGVESDPRFVYNAISSWVVYHFHDTSLTAGARRQGPVNHNAALHHDAANLAALLYRIRETSPTSYNQIRDVVRLAAPFFDDFRLRPVPTNPNLIQLEWTQIDSEYPFLAHQLSDGTLRFICLATALLQPEPPTTMLFDEPELGLHPYALALVGNLFKQATVSDEPSMSRQIIVSTQSALLLNQFEPEDIVVVERDRGESIFRRLDRAPLSEWLEEYTLGELWQKNVLGGRPSLERTPRLVPDWN